MKKIKIINKKNKKVFINRSVLSKASKGLFISLICWISADSLLNLEIPNVCFYNTISYYGGKSFNFSFRELIGYFLANTIPILIVFLIERKNKKINLLYRAWTQKESTIISLSILFSFLIKITDSSLCVKQNIKINEISQGIFTYIVIISSIVLIFRFANQFGIIELSDLLSITDFLSSFQNLVSGIANTRDLFRQFFMFSCFLLLLYYYQDCTYTLNMTKLDFKNITQKNKTLKVKLSELGSFEIRMIFSILTEESTFFFIAYQNTITKIIIFTSVLIMNFLMTSVKFDLNQKDFVESPYFVEIPKKQKNKYYIIEKGKLMFEDNEKYVFKATFLKLILLSSFMQFSTYLTQQRIFFTVPLAVVWHFILSCMNIYKEIKTISICVRFPFPELIKNAN